MIVLAESGCAAFRGFVNQYHFRFLVVFHKYSSWVLKYLSAYPEVTLATGSEKLSVFDPVKSTTSSSSKNTQTASRFLRREKVASTSTAIDVDNADNEERHANIGGVALTGIEAIYKGAGKIVGQSNVNKLRTKLRELRVKWLYKMKTDPDNFLARAKNQPHPILKARHEKTAEMYKALLQRK
ncbi:hypothetical protein PHMEG_00023630 [Phytophthora megakarya]|uniref:RxLR effector protein n=1 Tax=Phytophthora megakarya TaxID=4795 RepID=A0A225VH79_9STRA|nr:hypothetical protein PHMEG_00023630 [Phytophthora megakarya]